MEFLIIYESIEGQTRKIARYIESEIRKAGHSVGMFNAECKTAPLSFEGVERVILVAPVHERRHPPNFEVLVSASQEDLRNRPTLMISVSLKAAFPEGLDEAKDYLIEMEMRTGFTPTSELLVAGAVRTSSYDYFESQIIRNVVLRDQEIDLDGGIREFTDWGEVATKVKNFMLARSTIQAAFKE